jgi:1-phosphofructokinase family hexose kinase
MRNQGVKVFLDADGLPFRKGIEALPCAIKPNTYELERLAGKSMKRKRDIVLFGKKLVEKGVEFVLISMAEKGMFLFSEKHNLKATPPKVKIRSSIGAGDASVAGFIWAFEQEKSLTECLRMAVACGTATVLTPGTALCKKGDVKKILKQCKISKLT